jgi:hypothetical protein
MTQKNKLLLMYGAGILMASVIVGFVYTTNKTKSKLQGSATATEEETPTPEGTKTNPFTSYVNNPLPSSIDWKPRDLTTFFRSDVV